MKTTKDLITKRVSAFQKCQLALNAIFFPYGNERDKFFSAKKVQQDILPKKTPFFVHTELNPPELNRSVSFITSLADISFLGGKRSDSFHFENIHLPSTGFGSSTELHMKTDQFLVRSCPCFKGVFSETQVVFSP